VTDGRRRRGEAARRALLEATLRIIERDGVAGVTHRRVTAEAGLPATAAAYHFASITDLLEAALLQADEKSAAVLAAIADKDDPIHELAEWLVTDFAEQRQRCTAEYELFLYAARTPQLRTAALRWTTDLSKLVATWTEDAAARRRVTSYVDGMLIQAVVSGDIPPAQVIDADIRALVG
jgi:DNA-binding transcriptional regulator YbjK